MKYTGRFGALGLVLVFSSICIIHEYVPFHHSMNPQSWGFDIGVILIAVAIAWWLGNKYDKMTFFAEMDMLTEVYNRRYACDLFPKLVSLSERRLEKLSVLMVDTNQLKFINDTYGHQLGDAVIWHVSNILLENTRKTDVVSRFGGDEFLVIAPFTDQAIASDIAQRIHEGLLAESSEFPVPITAAIGVATYPDDGRSLDALLNAADSRMYQNKRACRQKA